jgi:hypothetical protein
LAALTLITLATALAALGIKAGLLNGVASGPPLVY